MSSEHLKFFKEGLKFDRFSLINSLVSLSFNKKKKKGYKFNSYLIKKKYNFQTVPFYDKWTCLFMFFNDYTGYLSIKLSHPFYTCIDVIVGI